MNNTIILTGGVGFIGHHMVEHIMRGFTEFDEDTEIVILDCLDETSTLERLRTVDTYSEWRDRVHFLWHDLKSPINSTVSSLIDEYVYEGKKPYVIHLAAGTHVDRSIVEPMEFVQDNIVGTVNLLNWCREYECEKILLFSTDEVYGPTRTTEFKEGARHNPGNPYAATKAAAESMGRAYRNTYDLPILITNCMNAFGERQHPEKFIPLTIKKCLEGRKHIIHADASKTVPGSRFYLHARNASDAAIWVLLNGDPFESEGPDSGQYHIVGQQEVDNLDLVKRIHLLVDEYAPDESMPLYTELVDYHSSRPGHDLRYAQSGEKLRDSGYEFSMSLDQSLEKTVQWYLRHRSWLNLESNGLL